MKIRFVFLLCIIFSFLLNISPVYAGDLEERVENANDVIKEVMRIPEKGIPTELIKNCRAIAIFPNVLKGGFIFGGKFGKGVICSYNPETGHWSQPAFFTVGGGSWGLQIGAQSIDLVLVIMSKRGLDGLLTSKVKLGGDIGVAAGPVGRRAEAGVDLFLKAEILSYSRTKGLFAGLSLEGATIFQSKDANRAFYGKELTAREILIKHKAHTTPEGEKLRATLAQYSQ